MDLPRSSGARAALALALAMGARPAAAQLPDTTRDFPAWATVLRGVGSGEEDRARVLQLLGREPMEGYAIRSPSALVPREDPAWRRPFLAPLLPQARVVYNSALPFSLNEGSLWAGKGVGVMVTAGARARVGRVTLTLAPELVQFQNADFQTLIPPTGNVSRYASPFHATGYTLDRPQRFGLESHLAFTLGQSSLVARAGSFDVGAAKESQWWGPGIRNALVMSNNAPGILHLFARTGVPLRTRAGEFEGKWMVGALNESSYFDRRGGNNVSSVSALALAWRPVWEPNLTLGATRAVYAVADGTPSVAGHAADVLLRTGEDKDQIFSLFSRWAFPGSGIEAYGEWARQRGIASPRLFLNGAGEPWAYTLGLQWARPTSATGIFRLQVELSDLEKGIVEQDGTPVHSYYTSERVPQGYTNRGRTLGAAIGPGSSSQWIAADHLGPRWEAGAYAARIRWDNDALYSTYQASPLGHDVTALVGLRGALRARGYRIGAELTAGKRYNYLFQVVNPALEDPVGVDLPNRTLRLTVEPLRR